MGSYNISPQKRYEIPQDICIVNYKDYILVIAPLSANWIVLESSEQLAVFNFLKDGHSIEESLAVFNQQVVSFVVTQIEARMLCTKKVHSTVDDKRSLHLHLTNKCNLSCPHCYMFSGKPKNDELTTDEIVKLITDYKSIANGERITLSGGEPTAHIDFDLIIKTAAELGLKVKLLTNGALLTPVKIAEIAKYIESVQISIDGYSEESNSIIRGKGHFQKALLAVDAFVNNGVETSIAVTPTLDLLRNHVDEYADFAIGLSQKYMGKPFQVKFAEGLSAGREVNPSANFNDEYAHIVSEIHSKIYEEDYDFITFVDTMSNNIILDNCMFGIFAVTSDGDVYLCPEVGALSPIANVRTSDFKDIFEQSLNAERATSISKLKPCNACELRFICGGGCRTKEFPELVNLKSFDNVDYEQIPSRYCDSKIKEKLYSLMVRSNEYLYSSL